MKLLHPDLGEVLDRLTIVSRKCLEAERSGVPRFGIDAEWTALTGWLEEHLSPREAALILGTLRLATVNAAIWDLTDGIDEARVTDADFGKWARHWNRRRSRLVKRIAEIGEES